MQTYDDLLKMHGFGMLYKHPEIPDFDLNIGDAERFNEQENIQLAAVVINTPSKALIDPELMSVEDLGIVGDGLGQVDHEDFLSGGYPFGNPIEEVY